MKKKIIAAMAVLGIVGLAQASTIGWNFDDLDGIADVNDSGLAVSEYTAFARTSAGVISTSVWDTAVTDGMMKTGATKVSQENNSHHRFTVTIGAGDTVDFTNLSFEQGADKQDGKEWDPDLNLVIFVGGITNQVIDLTRLSLFAAKSGLFAKFSLEGLHYISFSALRSGAGAGRAG